jgi:hypothetical protein
VQKFLEPEERGRAFVVDTQGYAAGDLVDFHQGRRLGLSGRPQSGEQDDAGQTAPETGKADFDGWAVTSVDWRGSRTGELDDRDCRFLDDRAILRNVIRPASKRLGFYFEGRGWHSFRRQNITVLQEEGATAFEAMTQAGHSRPAMTGEYTIVGL